MNTNLSTDDFRRPGVDGSDELIEIRAHAQWDGRLLYTIALPGSHGRHSAALSFGQAMGAMVDFLDAHDIESGQVSEDVELLIEWRDEVAIEFAKINA